MKRERLERLIGLVDHILKGDITMDFKPFDASEIRRAQEQYAEEAKARWGDSPAYAQSAKKTGAYTTADWERIHAEMQAVYGGLASCMEEGPASPRAQALVGQWQALITRYFYDCTDEILAGLGEMYVADERFTRQIDSYAKGLAVFLRDAIRLHCGGAKG